MHFSSHIKQSFIAGILLVTPLIVTVYVIWIVFLWLRQFIDPVASILGVSRYTANNEFIGQIVAILFVITTITVLGFLAQRRIGQFVFGRFGRAVTLVPLVRTMYTSVRQVAGSLTRGPSRYESVVLVEYPRRDLYSIGLVTGESPRVISGQIGEPVYNVFLPNSPNPTGGRLVHVPETHVHEIDMSVRRGLRLLVTTGLGDERLPPELPQD